MKLSTKQKTILIAVTIALIAVASLSIVIAATTWSGTRTYTKPVASFSVDKPTTLDYGTVNNFVETFTVTNTGNTATTIAASATGTGATYSWDKISAYLVAGASTTFTLTTTVESSGTTTVTFAQS
jgi:ABC-type oligopeptide transport system substrate-binding subunit